MPSLVVGAPSAVSGLFGLSASMTSWGRAALTLTRTEGCGIHILRSGLIKIILLRMSAWHKEYAEQYDNVTSRVAFGC
jgi:hypothetical protein